MTFDAKANRFDRIIGDLWASKDLQSKSNFIHARDSHPPNPPAQQQQQPPQDNNKSGNVTQGAITKDEIDEDGQPKRLQQHQPPYDFLPSPNEKLFLSDYSENTMFASGRDPNSDMSQMTRSFNHFETGNYFGNDSVGNSSSPSWSPMAGSPASSGETQFGLDHDSMRNNYLDIIKIESLSSGYSRNKNKKHGRPGRKAKRPDTELSEMELAKRELRRERNKEAARRCRQRRLDKTRGLEDQVSDLQIENGHLEYDNERLRKQIETLRFQLDSFCNGHGLQLHPTPESIHLSSIEPKKLHFNQVRESNIIQHGPLTHPIAQYNPNPHGLYPGIVQNPQHPLATRIVSKTPSGARKEVSIEKKEQTIFMNL